MQGRVLAYLGVLVVIALLGFLNSRVQVACIYSELNRREKVPQSKHAGRYRFLDRFGLTGEYMKLELKMIFRNKAPRKNFQMMTVVIVLFALSLLGVSHVGEKEFSACICMWCIALRDTPSASCRVSWPMKVTTSTDC